MEADRPLSHSPLVEEGESENGLSAIEYGNS